MSERPEPADVLTNLPAYDRPRVVAGGVQRAAVPTGQEAEGCRHFPEGTVPLAAMQAECDRGSVSQDTTLHRAVASIHAALRSLGSVLAGFVSDQRLCRDLNDAFRKLRAARSSPDPDERATWREIGKYLPRDAARLARYMKEPKKPRGRPKGSGLQQTDDELLVLAEAACGPHASPSKLLDWIETHAPAHLRRGNSAASRRKRLQRRLAARRENKFT